MSQVGATNNNNNAFEAARGNGQKGLPCPSQSGPMGREGVNTIPTVICTEG